VLFCTNDLYDNLTDLEIEEIVNGSDQLGAEHLVSVAYQRSQQVYMRAKQDDIISAIVVWFAPGEI